MGFWTFGNIRTLLDTETDHDSPGSEELVSQIRENIEALFMSLLDTGVSGTATSDPSNDANGYFYDTAGGWTNDLHNGRTLLITSGAAKGNMYTIDDTVDASDRLDCTGDNLYADGVRSGDSYKILYDLLVNTDGHDHDGVNSPAPVLADNYIAKGKLKTGGTNVSGTNTGSVVITLQDYCFTPNVYQAGADASSTMCAVSTNNADYVGRFSLFAGGSSAYIVYFRYVTSSDEPFIYIAREKSSGKILHCWAGEDPPPGCWGLDATPEAFERPVIGYDRAGRPDFDPDLHEEVISWRIRRDVWLTIKDRLTAGGRKPLHHVLENDFDYDKEAGLWKSKNLITI